MTKKEFEKRCATLAEQMHALIMEALKTCPEMVSQNGTGAMLSIFVDSDANGYMHVDAYRTSLNEHGASDAGEYLTGLYSINNKWFRREKPDDVLCEWGGEADDDR